MRKIKRKEKGGGARIFFVGTERRAKPPVLPEISIKILTRCQNFILMKKTIEQQKIIY